MMKFLLISILVATLATGAVFGLATMGHEADHMTNCFASLAQGVLCPQFSGLLDLVTFHFNVLARLSSAIFGPIFFVLGVFTFLLFGRIIFITQPIRNQAQQSRRLDAQNFSQHQSQLTHWLALLVTDN